MSISVLSQASAFNPGSDLWIVPDLEKSQWTEKLDWYLNFQICRSSRHQAPRLPEYVKDVLSETGLPKQDLTQNKQAPLMIASSELLPNKWVVILPWQDDLSQWTAEAYKVWHSLQKPTLRVFLPPGQSTGNLQRAWQSHTDSQEFTVVLD